MIKDFEFVDDGRTFTCTIEEPRHARAEKWWWFAVSNRDGNRYAPFQTSASDTRASVQARIVKFYDDLLAHRALPVVPRTPWRRPDPKPAPAVVESKPD